MSLTETSETIELYNPRNFMLTIKAPQTRNVDAKPRDHGGGIAPLMYIIIEVIMRSLVGLSPWTRVRADGISRESAGMHRPCGYTSHAPQHPHNPVYCDRVTRVLRVHALLDPTLKYVDAN